MTVTLKKLILSLSENSLGFQDERIQILSSFFENFDLSSQSSFPWYNNYSISRWKIALNLLELKCTKVIIIPPYFPLLKEKHL